jgi:hypothetical protein
MAQWEVKANPLGCRLAARLTLIIDWALDVGILSGRSQYANVSDAECGPGYREA